jgi:hypothetical protein
MAKASPVAEEKTRDRPENEGRETDHCNTGEYPDQAYPNERLKCRTAHECRSYGHGLRLFVGYRVTLVYDVL